MAHFELRPLTIGELLDRTFALYRRHFWFFAGLLAPLVAVEVLTGSALQIVMYRSGLLPQFAPVPQPNGGPPVLPDIGVVTVVAFVASTVLAIAVTLLRLWISLSATTRAADELLHERPLGSRDVTRLLFTRLGGLLWLMIQIAVRTMFIVGLTIGIPIAFLIALQTAAGAASPARAIATILGVLIVMLLGFGAFIVVALRYALAIPAFVVEALPAGAAIRRSIALTRGYMGRTFVVYLVSTVVVVTGQTLVTMPFTGMTLRYSFRGEVPPLWIAMATQLATGVANLAMGPLVILPFVMLYYDLRVRKEALDLDLLLKATPVEAAAASAEPS